METKSIEGKLIVAAYINVGNLPKADVNNFIAKTKEISNLAKLESLDDVLVIYIPVRGEQTRIEVIK